MEQLFENLLNQFKSVDLAHAELRRLMADDPELRREYSQWCEEQGVAERYGFLDFAAEYIEQQNSIWDSLTDYDAEE